MPYNYWHPHVSTGTQHFSSNDIDCEQPDISLVLSQNLYAEADRNIFDEMSNPALLHKQHLVALTSPALFRQYQLSQKKYFDFGSILQLGLIYFMAVATRFNLQNVGVSGPLFTATFLTLLVTFVLYFGYIFAHLTVCFTAKTNRIYRFSERFLLLWFGGRIVDVLALLATITMGLYLLARVDAGQCASMTDIWLSQTCNPVAISRSIPHDGVILLYSIPISAQVAFRGVSFEALLLIWLIVICFLIYAFARVEGWLQIWTIAYSLFFMNISYEVERLMRVAFVQTSAMLAAERLKLIRDLQREAEVNLTQLRNRHELEIVEVSAENERKLREKENFQLRSLMGNVAHDLKTPLHSIEADLEVLRVFVTKIPRGLLDRTTAEFRSKGVGDTFDPISIFDSLNATCKFMEMAINRSQDFMKASNNIALVPVMETFDLKIALAMSVTCINHLQSARFINLHSINAIDICSHLISDKHWLIENSLCLLSNAMKYSDDGVVDIRVALITVPINDSMKRTSITLGTGPLIYVEKSSMSSDPRSVPSTSTSTSTEVQHALDSNSSTLSMDPNNNYEKGYVKTRQMVMISVEDTGIGISYESRKNLFQPFKQAQRMAGGTGLGLYSLSKRIEALGGMAGVTSRSDNKQGSMFWFTFPYRPDEQAALVDVHVDIIPGVGVDIMTDHIQPIRILIVDDSLSILKVTSRLLKMNGHSVETASNGSIGLKRLKEVYDNGDIDMVLTDLQMPVMDGVEATSRFRKFESEKMMEYDGKCMNRRKKLLIVGMSANSDTQSKEEALNSGMDYFVTKPFAYKDLMQILSNAICPPTILSMDESNSVVI